MNKINKVTLDYIFRYPVEMGTILGLNALSIATGAIGSACIYDIINSRKHQRLCNENNMQRNHEVDQRKHEIEILDKKNNHELIMAKLLYEDKEKERKSKWFKFY